MKKEKLTYLESVHRDGRIWGIALCLVILLFPVAVCLVFKTVPQWNALLKGALAVMPMYWAVGIVEMFTYIPMLGAGGAYLSFVTGNISNLKLPVGLNAMNTAKVKANTEEGEVISTIAIGVSAIVTTVIIAAGVVIFSIFVKPEVLQSPAIKPAFDFVLPALFGALAASYFEKYWKPCSSVY